jgi:hypothetical protein
MSSIYEYNILDLSSSQEWNKYLQRVPIEQRDTYYTPEYYSLYEKLGDGSARCFVFENEGYIALYPFLINSVNALGYNLDRNYYDIQGAYGYNGVVANNNSSVFRNKFYKAFNDYCKSANIIAEFTRFHPLLKNEFFSIENLKVIFDRKTVYIDLQDDYLNIFRRFQTTTRKQIKRAINRYAIQVEVIERSTESLSSFIDIYYQSLNRINSDHYLYFNKTYFEELLLNIQSVCFYSLYEGKPIAGIIAFYNDKYIHGHLGGALTEYLRLSPYSLLYSEMIKFGQKKGCNVLHVGGGATNNPNDSLLRFKSNFSDSVANFQIGRKIHYEYVYNNVVTQWEAKYPEKTEKYKNFLLKYRY